MIKNYLASLKSALLFKVDIDPMTLSPILLRCSSHQLLLAYIPYSRGITLVSDGHYKREVMQPQF
ncbi:hypothetical protein, partial [Persicitalea sp.]|uniref:hypothetical protein n=1 Tax=Persicitalea sp. TaxID=3100273 RepID=UPI00359462D9